VVQRRCGGAEVVQRVGLRAEMWCSCRGGAGAVVQVLVQVQRWYRQTRFC